MNIVVITHNYIRRRGDLTALYLHRLSAGLVERGLKLTVVCPHASGLLPEETIDGVRIIRFPYPFFRLKPIAYTGNMHQEVAGSIFARLVFVCFLWSFYRAAGRVCRSEKADLIWANWWIPPGLVAARIASRLGTPLVISSHGTDISLLGKGHLIRALSTYVYHRTSRATVVSAFLKERLCRQVGDFSPDRAVVLPMPIGMENFPKAALPDHEVPVILSVARFTRQKRLDDLIAACAKVAAEGIPFCLRMVGEGPLEEELRDRVRQAGLSDRVEFIPLVAQQKLGRLYREADVVTLVSEDEGFGLVLVEAGATGRPVVAARSGGIVDIVGHDRNGLLFTVGDRDGLAEALKRILVDRDLRTRLGDGGFTRVMADFATPVLIDRMYRLFVSLCDSSPSGEAS